MSCISILLPLNMQALCCGIRELVRVPTPDSCSWSAPMLKAERGRTCTGVYIYIYTQTYVYVYMLLHVFTHAGHCVFFKRTVIFQIPFSVPVLERG